MYLCMNVCMYVSKYVCMYVCIYRYIHIFRRHADRSGCVVRHGAAKVGRPPALHFQTERRIMAHIRQSIIRQSFTAHVRQSIMANIRQSLRHADRSGRVIGHGAAEGRRPPARHPVPCTGRGSPISPGLTVLFVALTVLFLARIWP